MMDVQDLERWAEACERVKSGEAMAAPRDATCYNSPSNYPGSHSGGKYHAVTSMGTARCSGALLVLELVLSAADVDEVLLCRRAACVCVWQGSRL